MFLLTYERIKSNIFTLCKLKKNIVLKYADVIQIKYIYSDTKSH